MNELGAISPVSATVETGLTSQVTVTRFPTDTAAAASVPLTDNFGSILSDAIARLDSKVADADRLVAQFAVDESTPIHHVTIALEEARMAVELATQVRQRLTEGYRELMNMQL
jgi:flagellar hook-basal body complex protein FliE